jgi:hypothetical protein
MATETTLKYSGTLGRAEGGNSATGAGCAADALLT